MKIRLWLTVFLCVLLVWISAEPVHAETAENLKERWYDVFDYPLYQGSAEWQKLDMTSTLDVLNPPSELLLSALTEELADLMMRYPCMSQITSYYDENGNQDYSTFFAFMESQSDIFFELLRREDGIRCLLEAWRNSGVDSEWLKDENKIYGSAKEMSKWYAEIFGSQLIHHYGSLFTADESELANRIMEEKSKIYEQASEATAGYFDVTPLPVENREVTEGVRAKHLSDEIKKDKEKVIEETLIKIKSQEEPANQFAATEDPVLEPAKPSTTNDHHNKLLIAAGVIVAILLVMAGAWLFLRRKK